MSEITLTDSVTYGLTTSLRKLSRSADDLGLKTSLLLQRADELSEMVDSYCRLNQEMIICEQENESDCEEQIKQKDVQVQRILSRADKILKDTIYTEMKSEEEHQL